MGVVASRVATGEGAAAARVGVAVGVAAAASAAFLAAMVAFFSEMAFSLGVFAAFLAAAPSSVASAAAAPSALLARFLFLAWPPCPAFPPLPYQHTKQNTKTPCHFLTGIAGASPAS